MNCKWILVVDCKVSSVDFPLWDSATGWPDKQEAAGVWCLTRDASNPAVTPWEMCGVTPEERVAAAAPQKKTLIPCTWDAAALPDVTELNDRFPSVICHPA